MMTSIVMRAFLIFAIMWFSFGVAGPALVSANSYVLMFVGFAWMAGSVAASIYVFSTIVNIISKDEDDDEDK